ncbi:MAG TPA: hypothetical protein VMH81_25505 [Bryobacteraceae bacterium]|nr:hypothetical protein [Bryobacteraceae bacterium]
MNRRTRLVLAGITLMGLMASPQLGFAQSESDPFLGVWQLNVAKSKYSPGPPPKSQTMYIWEDEAKIRKNSQVTINGAGVPNAVVLIHIYDDTPRPVPGAQGYDSSAYMRVDAHTVKSRYLNAGKVLQTATWTVSQDGKTLTYTGTGVDANGRQVNQLRIYEKQQ